MLACRFAVAITEWGAEIVHVYVEPVEVRCFVPISDTIRRLRTVPAGTIFRAAQAVPLVTLTLLLFHLLCSHSFIHLSHHPSPGYTPEPADNEWIGTVN
jgi:hypothetical protein